MQSLMDYSTSSGESEEESCDDGDDNISPKMQSSDSELDTNSSESVNNISPDGDHPDVIAINMLSSAESKTSDDLSVVLTPGLPQKINTNLFPEEFRIVICLQHQELVQ